MPVTAGAKGSAVMRCYRLAGASGVEPPKAELHSTPMTAKIVPVSGASRTQHAAVLVPSGKRRRRPRRAAPTPCARPRGAVTTARAAAYRSRHRAGDAWQVRFRATPESRGCLRTSPPAARTAETVHAFRLFSPETAASLVSEAKLAAGRVGYKDRGVRLPTDDIVIEGLSGHHRDLNSAPRACTTVRSMLHGTSKQGRRARAPHPPPDRLL